VTDPGPHPDPPEDLGGRKLPIKSYAGPWFRFHKHELGPLHFGRSGQFRFDAPRQEFGVLYVARDEFGAFIETFGRGSGRLVDQAQLEARRLTRVRSRRPIHLVDLAGAGLARLEADSRLTAGDYRVAQRWSLGFYNHPTHPDGMVYPARHDASRLCAALFDRLGAELEVEQTIDLADREHRRLLGALLDTYDFELLQIR